MCGICGVVDFNGAHCVETNTIQAMLQSMVHRGPDDGGSYVCGNVGLGSRRLSIIDLAGGHQPIANEDESLWIVFNGEIYNYRELRAYLTQRGHQFRTHTDTEVILHLYEDLGVESIQHLNGIFAFAIWDARRKQVTLARDRMGIKPLYYTLVDDTLVFGSEMKVVLAHSAVKRELDLISLNEYLSFEYVPSPRTIFRNISRLEPGYMLQFDEKGLRQHRYWNVSLALSESQPPVNWRDYGEQLHDTLFKSVQQELVSDVPVGVLLSGGLDSSTVAALMVKASPNTVKSFSIGFEDTSFNESHFARMVAQHVGTEHHEMILTSKVAAELTSNIADVLDEPFADSSMIPTYLLSKFAREHVKVVLGGDGGDELFVGYPTFKAHRLIEYYERVVPWHVRTYFVPGILNRMRVSFDNISLDFKMRRFLAGRGMPIQARHHRWLGAYMDEQKHQLLQDWIAPVLRDTYTQAYLHARDCDAHTPLNQLVYNDLKMYLEGDILFKVDRASMASSLEVRVPILNRDVVQFVTTLPLGLKLNRLTGKFLLKKSMERELPRAIIRRPKKGFNMPVARWLNGELRGLMHDMLGEERLKRQGLFNPVYVNQLMTDHASQQKDNRKELWTLLIFQLWYDRYVAA